MIASYDSATGTSRRTSGSSPGPSAAPYGGHARYGRHTLTVHGSSGGFRVGADYTLIVGTGRQA